MPRSTPNLARITVAYHAGNPAFWRVDRHVGDHQATWTFLTADEADRFAADAAQWPDDHRPAGWGLLGHLYDAEERRGR